MDDIEGLNDLELVGLKPKLPSKIWVYVRIENRRPELTIELPLGLVNGKISAPVETPSMYVLEHVQK